MEAIPKKALMAVAVALAALSVIGVYQGWRRSAVDEAQTGADGSPLPTTPAVAGARQASALVEPPPVALTEAQVRDIARQEVRASLRGDSAPAGASSPAAGAAGSAPSGASTPPAPRPPAPAPIAVPPPPPAAEPAPAPAAPLF